MTNDTCQECGVEVDADVQGDGDARRMWYTARVQQGDLERDVCPETGDDHRVAFRF